MFTSEENESLCVHFVILHGFWECHCINTAEMFSGIFFFSFNNFFNQKWGSGKFVSEFNYLMLTFHFKIYKMNPILSPSLLRFLITGPYSK